MKKRGKIKAKKKQRNRLRCKYFKQEGKKEKKQCSNAVLQEF
jgi:hypothetical protein